ncbi:hypothetical protein Tco_0749362 [Tanacetum coccineum]|uniref:Uncharacterized protein n=1 Tax=Tanacetum coccineum TaxID=301880 RepID=A0ABQ4YZ75_9ASTR
MRGSAGRWCAGRDGDGVDVSASERGAGRGPRIVSADGRGSKERFGGTSVGGRLIGKQPGSRVWWRREGCRERGRRRTCGNSDEGDEGRFRGALQRGSEGARVIENEADEETGESSRRADREEGDLRGRAEVRDRSYGECVWWIRGGGGGSLRRTRLIGWRRNEEMQLDDEQSVRMIVVKSPGYEMRERRSSWLSEIGTLGTVWGRGGEDVRCFSGGGKKSETRTISLGRLSEGEAEAEREREREERDVVVCYLLKAGLRYDDYNLTKSGQGGNVRKISIIGLGLKARVGLAKQSSSN